MTEYAAEASEQLDQLQPDATLIDRGVADVLDEGYTTPENWSPAQGFGNTPAEMRRGETLEQRVVQEQPETVPDDTPWNPDPTEEREVGSRRAGRLVDVQGGYDQEDTVKETVARDVGIDGGAASAEEAAMHVIEPFDNEDD
ncbi:MAG: DUF5709 domain-containing protein [Propionibacteriaceae bacterium]|jgi:hypothetical protein|nr:DUF5709 domain-containing protein [Propionibacteriaceae bacterium]